ncbi:MAG: ABC transporter ATP-binding protein [Candidatus Binatia bacterium]|nr:ABC transporter ATP-binding protein [Candidatus Binatia bacterium]
MKIIAVDRATKEYGFGAAATRALDDVSLDVEPGEFVAIMGPSGCGKSTLLNLIAAFDRPTSGSITVAGQDLARLSEHRLSLLRAQHIGFVVQSFNLLPRLTIEENVWAPLGAVGVSLRESRERARGLLELVGLSQNRAARFPLELSGGEQQRVAIARALVGAPAILLADEPTGNLDSRNGIRALNLLRDLSTDRKMAVVLVTHDSFAATYGNRTVLMQDGRVVEEIGPGEKPSVGSLESIEGGR